MSAPAVTALRCGDEPALWESLGFTVADGACVVGGVRIELTGDGTGLRAWSVDGATPDESGRIDGLRTSVAPPPASSPAHANGITEVDHVVVTTPNMPRTLQAISGAGFELRREAVRVDTYGAPALQAFFRPLGTIIEVVGPADPSDGPARFFGLCFTADDLDATASFLGDRLKPAKTAVQPGRRIATLASSAGSAVAIAILSPHVDSVG